jgi:hypothetical protein
MTKYLHPLSALDAIDSGLMALYLQTSALIPKKPEASQTFISYKNGLAYRN